MPASKKPVKKVTQPYLKGKPVDSALPLNALRFFGGLGLLMLMNVLLSALMSLETAWLKALVCILIILGTVVLFFLAGAGSGTKLVARSENFYDRKASGRTMYAGEEASCYHPLKGLLYALVGSLPVLAVAIWLALIAQRQVTSYGVLPSWVSTSAQPQLAAALDYYNTAATTSVETILRVIVRLLILPYVGLVGSESSEALLTLERLSPLLLLLPAISYGIGFTQGPARRTLVHTKIAENIRQRRKQEKKAQKKRSGSLITAPVKQKKPEELN